MRSRTNRPAGLRALAACLSFVALLAVAAMLAPVGRGASLSGSGIVTGLGQQIPDVPHFCFGLP
ncbi:MAG TPA: hypothetical protein VGK33_15135, partial [Chloroflexota bacterium]